MQRDIAYTENLNIRNIGYHSVILSSAFCSFASIID